MINMPLPLIVVYHGHHSSVWRYQNAVGHNHCAPVYWNKLAIAYTSRSLCDFKVWDAPQDMLLIKLYL